MLLEPRGQAPCVRVLTTFGHCFPTQAFRFFSCYLPPCRFLFSAIQWTCRFSPLRDGTGSVACSRSDRRTRLLPSDKLDGVMAARKRKDSAAPTMEDYLQLPDDYASRAQSSGKKRVRARGKLSHMGSPCGLGS